MGRKILLLSTFMLCLSGTVLSQITPITVIDLRRLQKDFEQARSTAEGSTPVYEGTPYLFEEFTGADIHLKEGRGYEAIPMNYNIHNDDFEYKMENISYSLGNNDLVNYISVGDRKFYYMTYTYNSAEIKGYLELVADGDYRFFKKHRVIYTAPQPTRGYVEAQAAKFSSRSPDYFIELKNGTIVYFNKLDEIARLVPEEGRRLKDFIKKERLKARREEDIVRLADFINGL
ncbi:MAG: hypothetical protein RQ743_09120 [Bacteroidales bacterium]|nr:hypothetical protein [Bacteroidales bacterium]